MDPVDKHVEDFLIHIRIERNYSPATEHSYRFALSIFLQFLTQTHRELTDKKCIPEFIRCLQDRGNGDITIAHRLAVLKSFFAYLVRKGIVRKNRMPVIEKYKTTRKIISIPTEGEVNLFIQSIEEQYKQLHAQVEADSQPNGKQKAKSFSLFRDLTLFTLITATGLRISEALRIAEPEINWNDFSIKILGKGSKERLIYFGIERLKELLRRLLELKQQLGIESPYLFVSCQHRAPVTPRYIQKLMKAFLTKTSSSCYTPHTLRHYYATRSIEKGANIKAIAVLLGHADVSTTLKMYCHLSAQVLKQVFETLNPFSAITLPVEQMIKLRYETLVNL
jgi:integrase/recombinase XerC